MNSRVTYTMTPQRLYDQIHNATPEQNMAIGSRCSCVQISIVITWALENSPAVEMRTKDKRGHRHISRIAARLIIMWTSDKIDYLIGSDHSCSDCI